MAYHLDRMDRIWQSVVVQKDPSEDGWSGGIAMEEGMTAVLDSWPRRERVVVAVSPLLFLANRPLIQLFSS